MTSYQASVTYVGLPVEVKRIANASLGYGVLQSLFSYDNTYNLLLKISNGETVGFALYHELTQDGKWVGVIDCVCVAPEFRGMGFGSALTFAVLRKLRDCERVEVMLIMPGDDSDIDEKSAFGSIDFLESLGFRRIRVYPHFYQTNEGLTDVDSCDGLLMSLS